MKSRSVHTFAVLASAGLIVGAFAAGPADAAKKKRKPPACAAYVPHEKAAEAELVKVTEAATAEAPIELEVETAPGLGSGRPGGDGTFAALGENTSEAFVNVQVDTKAPVASGLYVTVEFTPAWDYDLYLDDSTGTEVAHSAGFLNQTFGAGAAAESAIGSENILGIETADCGGYSVDIAGATTPGETVTLKLWLGEIQAAPAE